MQGGSGGGEAYVPHDLLPEGGSCPMIATSVLQEGLVLLLICAAIRIRGTISNGTVLALRHCHQSKQITILLNYRGSREGFSNA